MKKFSFFILSSAALMAAPPRHIPDDLYNEYTLNGQIKVVDFYLDNTAQHDDPIEWTTKQINSFIKDAQLKRQKYYGPTDKWLHKALTKYDKALKGKRVAIIGSETPWYESIALSYGLIPVTIEYNEIICNDPRIETHLVTEFEENPEQFDAIISISSIEHSGLGRYGDDLNPNGDLETMEKAKGWLKPGGLFFFAVPVTQDSVSWNAHRTYGPIRLPMILKGWKKLDVFGFNPKKDFKRDPFLEHSHQPVFVLQAEK